MKRYFCNGKKGYCDRGNDNKIDCSACEFADGTGGKVVDCPDTNYEKIKAMSIDEMVEFLEAVGDSPCTTICNNFDKCRLNISIERICKNHFKEWLEGEVEEE